MSIFSHIFTTVSTNAKSAIGLLCVLVIFMLGDCAQSNEMAPAVPKWSWTWSTTQSEYSKGDVVWVMDLIDGVSSHPMRILATGDTIQYQNDGFV